MARKRQLPPDICQWPAFQNLTHDARLLYMLLYTMADDEGRIREQPGRFAYKLFPGETAFALKIEACLREIDREGLIGRYEVGKLHCLVICAWSLQKVDHAAASKLPAPPATRQLALDEVAAVRAKRER